MRSSRSTTPSRGRRGFTLVELAVATAVLGVLLAALFSVFMGSRKTQGQAVTQSILKQESQRLFQSMYTELGQIRHIVASLDTAPVDEDVALAYYGRLEMPTGLVQQLPLPNVRFPRICPGGSFANRGTAVGQMNPIWFGNALMFISRVSSIRLATPDVQLMVGNAGAQRTLTPDKPYRLNSYKLIAYFMHEKVRAASEPPINGMNHTYGLTRWESRAFLDRAEVNGLFALMSDPADRQLVWKDLKDTFGLTRAWDSTALAPQQAFCDLDADGNFVPVDEPIAQQRIRTAINFGALEPYAKGFLSFNTTGTFKLQDFNGQNAAGQTGLDVPHFGEKQEIIPYGFEVGITGPNSGRAILVRVAMAARLAQGGHLYGQSQQTIIQAVDN